MNLVLLFLFVFALLIGWMPWELAIAIGALDWLLGYAIYTRVSRAQLQVEPIFNLQSAPPMITITHPGSTSRLAA